MRWLYWLLLLVPACGGTSPGNPIVDAAVNDGAPQPDAVVDASAGPPADAAGPPGDAAIGLPCGADPCVAGEECCVTGSPGSPVFDCIPIAESCTGGVSAECDGPEDCEGNACCAQLLGGPRVAATCSGEGSCTNGVALCHTADDCPDDVPNCCPIPGTTLGVCASAACIF